MGNEMGLSGFFGHRIDNGKIVQQFEILGVVDESDLLDESKYRLYEFGSEMEKFYNEWARLENAKEGIYG